MSGSWPCEGGGRGQGTVEWGVGTAGGSGHSCGIISFQSPQDYPTSLKQRVPRPSLSHTDTHDVNQAGTAGNSRVDPEPAPM